jgi:phosphoribosylformylglycinamidine synthase
VIEALLAIPTIAHKGFITEQYDSMVGSANMSTNRPSDAAIVRLHGRKDGLAVTADCNSLHVYSDPRQGAALAVSEAARNLACSGAKPLGVTNCLNFGNPYNPEVYFQFAQAIQGMGEACARFETPVTGGNVSFYNQSEHGPVFPTPTIGMVGYLTDAEQQQMTLDFKAEGDQIFLLGRVMEDYGSSQYLYHYHGITHSPVPYLHLDEEYALQQVLLDLIGQGLIRSAHDVSDGGLAVTLMESGFDRGLGFQVTTPTTLRKDAFLYGESGGRAVVSVDPEQVSRFEALAASHGVPTLLLGQVTAHAIQIDGKSLGDIAAFHHIYLHALTQRVNQTTSQEVLTD